MGMVAKKTELQEKCWSNRPPVIGPSATPRPVIPVHTPTAAALSLASVKVLVRMANVAGKIRAAARPIRQRATISTCVLPESPAKAENPAKRHQPDLEGALAPVPVAQAPPHQQQRREDEGVSVDDPLQVAGRRMELLADRGEGDVDDRVVDKREENAQAQDGEYRPPPGMHPVGAGWRCPSPQPGPGRAGQQRPAGAPRSSRTSRGPSSSPEPDSGPHRVSRETIGACIAALPVRRMSMWSRGATGDRSNAVDVAISLSEDLLRGK